METTSAPVPPVRSLVWVVIHGLLWVVLMGVLLFIVPRFEQRFKDFAILLPATTEGVIAASHWFVNYWFVVPPPFLAFLGFDGVILYLLRRSPGTVGWARLWAGLMALLPLAGLVMVGLAIWLPYTKLLEGLSR